VEHILNVLVLASSYYPRIDGVSVTVHNLSTGSSLNGNKVRVVTKWYANLTRVESESGVQISRVGYGKRMGGSLLFTLSLIKKTVSILRSEDVQIVHAHGTIPGLAAIIGRLVTGVPFLVTFHRTNDLSDISSNEMRNCCMRIAHKLVCRQADALTAQSEIFAKTLMQNLPIGETKIVLLPNPVNMPGMAHEKTRQTGGGQVILFVGNLIRRKGVETLIRAMPVVVRRIPGASLVVVGDGPQRVELEKLAAEEGVSGRIAFRGRLDESELTKAYADCDMFVLPSHSEFFGVVITEAMSHGKPVIASATNGAKSIIKNGECGILVGIGDSKELAREIVHLMTKPEEARMMGMRARMEIESRYSLEHVSNRLQEIYDSVLQGELVTAYE